MDDWTRAILDRKVSRMGYASASIMLLVLSFTSEYWPSAMWLGLAYAAIIDYLFLVTLWRLNDLELSKWKVLYYLVPFVNIFFYYYLLAKDGPAKGCLWWELNNNSPRAIDYEVYWKIIGTNICCLDASAGGGVFT
jgi:hypothetical protein